MAPMLARAAASRAVASTQMNERSSRSHSVFRLRISGKNSQTGEGDCSGGLILGQKECSRNSARTLLDLILCIRSAPSHFDPCVRLRFFSLLFLFLFFFFLVHFHKRTLCLLSLFCRGVLPVRVESCRSCGL